MAWIAAVDDTFARSNTTAGAAGSTTGVGNGWIDMAGGVWSLSGGKLLGSTADSSVTAPLKGLKRPSNEATVSGRITGAFLGSAGAIPGVGLRLQSGGDCYFAAIGNGAAFVFSIVGGNLSQILYAGLSTGLVATHQYVMDFQALGASPTALTFTVTDTTTGTTIANLSGSDGTASVQPAGVPTLVTWSNTSGGGVQSITYSEVATYTQGSATATGTITVSPTTLTAGTANQAVSVTGAGASLAGATFTIAGGLGAAIMGQSVQSATAATLTVSPGAAGGGSVTITSSAGGSATIAINPPNLGALKIGFVGDSITAGTNGDPVGAMNAYLTAQGYSVTAVNKGVSGSSTADWLPGGANLPGALSAFQAAGVTIVQVMLGTNDWRTGITVAQHVTNMRAIVAALRAAGFRVVLNKSPWAVPNGVVGGYTVPADANDRTRDAWKAYVQLCDGTNVAAGDTSAFEWTMLGNTAVLDSYGLHPKDGPTNVTLGQYWAVAFMQRYGAAIARWTHA